MVPDPAVLNHVAAEARRIGIPVSLGFCVVEGESQFNLDAEGDNGLAHGIIQVRTDVHGHDRAWWTGWAGMLRSFDLMRWRWVRAWEALGRDAAAWERDPVAFLKAYWPAAQGANKAVVERRAAAVVRDGMAIYDAWAAGKERGMVERPPIIQFQAHPRNIDVRPADIRYEALVWHTTAGGRTLEALASWFGGENLKAGLRGSTHFGVDQAGRIGQYVDLAAMPVAHGDETGATSRLARENSITANAWAIGIEHLDGGVPGSVTLAQLEASAWLSAWLWETQIMPHAHITGAVLDREHLLGHYELAPVSKPICPSWPAARYLEQQARMQARLTPPAPPPPPGPNWEGPFHQLMAEVEQWVRDDAAGAEMRAARVREWKGVRP